MVSKQDMLLFDQFHNISLTQVAFCGTSMVDRLPTQTTGRNIMQSVSHLMDAKYCWKAFSSVLPYEVDAICFEYKMLK